MIQPVIIIVLVRYVVRAEIEFKFHFWRTLSTVRHLGFDRKRMLTMLPLRPTHIAPISAKSVNQRPSY